MVAGCAGAHAQGARVKIVDTFRSQSASNRAHSGARRTFGTEWTSGFVRDRSITNTCDPVPLARAQHVRGRRAVCLPVFGAGSRMPKRSGRKALERLSVASAIRHAVLALANIVRSRKQNKTMRTASTRGGAAGFEKAQRAAILARPITSGVCRMRRPLLRICCKAPIFWNFVRWTNEIAEARPAHRSYRTSSLPYSLTRSVRSPPGFAPIEAFTEF
jgi:hypothetical protein